MMCIRWENKAKFLTAEAPRGVNSTIFDAQGSRIDNELGKWDNVTGTALEQGCEFDEVADTPVVSGSRKQTKTQSSTRQSLCDDRRRRHRRRSRFIKLSSRGSPTRSWTSLSRCRGRNPVSQTLSANHKDSTAKGFWRSWRFTRFEDSEERGDFPVSVLSSSLRRWLRSL